MWLAVVGDDITKVVLNDGKNRGYFLVSEKHVAKDVDRRGCAG